MTHRPPPEKPHMDPHHDLADASADAQHTGGAEPVGVQDRRGSRPIDRIEEPEGAGKKKGVQRERGKVGVAILVAAFLIVAGVVIGVFVMQRPVPTLGLAAIACGMLLLFAAPVLTATAVEPEPEPEADASSSSQGRVPGPRTGPPTPRADDTTVPTHR